MKEAAEKRSILMSMRRIVLALTISLAVHVSVLVVAIAFGLWQSRSLVSALRLRPISVEVVKDLPLGAPSPDKQAAPPREPPLTLPKPRHHVSKSRDGVTVPASPDAGAPPAKPDAAVEARPAGHDGGGVDGGRRKPGDLRSHGPDGSRLLALLRLDRLRALPDKDAIVAAVDQLLRLLPDRHRLIDDTGLDLYRDFDSLLIATPDPTDDAVTFLATRHHLTDGALRSALDRGAKAAHGAIEWRTVDGRPVGIRHQGKSSPNAGAALDRDNRILVLPQPSLAIMATPAYAERLLGPSAIVGKGPAGSIDAGTSERAVGGQPAKPVGHVGWQDLAKDIDAEDSAMPDDATFMMMATHLLIAGNDAPGLAVPPARGASDDSLPQPVGRRSPMPEAMTLVVGTDTPYIEIIADFKTAPEADQWQGDLPSWKRKIATNPIVLLSGFSGLVNRAETSRDGNTLQLRADTSAEELQRLLNLIANLARTALARPR